MKYLMVDNGRVFYSLDGSAASKKPIDQKFEDIRLHRVSFEDEKVNLYRIAINKYSSELSKNT